MRIFKRLLALFLLVTLVLTASGCYVISAQRMWRVKGTYKLTVYTYTPQYERREGYTPRTYNYIEDEEYRYEVYLVVTGEATGYYVYKDASTAAYYKEIPLSYEYEEEGSKVTYVIYGGVTLADQSTGTDRLGVTRDHLGYSKPAFDFTQPFTEKSMRSEDIRLSFERVDRATDLSYAEKQLGTLTQKP